MLKAALLGTVVVLLAGTIWGAALWRGPVPDGARPQDRVIALPGPAAEDVLRITVFGTSLSVPGRYDWPEIFAKELAACLNRAVDLHIVAQAGANVTWAQTQIDTVARSTPDIVLFEFATNDADLRDGLWRAQARAATHDVVHALGDLDPSPALVLMTMNPAQGARGVVRPLLAAHNRDYLRLADTMDAGLLDLAARWTDLPRAERTLADGLHPDPQRAREVIVPAVVDYVLQGLARGAGEDGAPLTCGVTP